MLSINYNLSIISVFSNHSLDRLNIAEMTQFSHISLVTCGGLNIQTFHHLSHRRQSTSLLAVQVIFVIIGEVALHCLKVKKYKFEIFNLTTRNKIKF